MIDPKEVTARKNELEAVKKMIGNKDMTIEEVEAIIRGKIEAYDCLLRSNFINDAKNTEAEYPTMISEMRESLVRQKNQVENLANVSLSAMYQIIIFESTDFEKLKTSMISTLIQKLAKNKKCLVVSDNTHTWMNLEIKSCILSEQLKNELKFSFLRPCDVDKQAIKQHKEIFFYSSDDSMSLLNQNKKLKYGLNASTEEHILYGFTNEHTVYLMHDLNCKFNYGDSLNVQKILLD